jgi:hypothetical protein
MLAPWSAASPVCLEGCNGDTRHAMAGGASGVAMSSLVPLCTLIAFLKRHSEGSGLFCFLFLWKAFEMQARLRID